MYWESPGFTLANQGNPNPNNNFTQIRVDQPDPNQRPDGLPIYEGPQQLGRVLSVSGARADFSPAVTYDPDLKDQYTHSSSVFFEREIGANFGVRTGFVWNGDPEPAHHRQHQPAVRGVQPADERSQSRARRRGGHGR